MSVSKFKKVLIHPVFLTVSPLVLTALILLLLHLLGGQYRNMPFLYSYF
jgi:hypothetical protein